MRLPKLRKIAGKVCRCRGTGYLLNAWDGTYEEIMLQGMVIGCLKEPFETVLPFIRAFLPKIDNWSVCDSFCCSLKIARREPEAVWEFVTECLRSERPYTVRFAVVMLLNYYVDEAHLPQVLCALDGIKSDFYYVRMAVAWAVSVCFVKFPGPVMEYAVEYRHELAFGIFQRIVDVARFRMFMSGTGDIFHRLRTIFRQWE